MNLENHSVLLDTDSIDPTRGYYYKDGDQFAPYSKPNRHDITEFINDSHDIFKELASYDDNNDLKKLNLLLKSDN